MTGQLPTADGASVSRRLPASVTVATLRLTGQAGEFLAFVVFARRLAVSEFGLLSVAYLVARYGGLVGDWGATFRGARDVAAGATEQVTALIRIRTWLSAAIAAVAAVGLWMVDPSLAPVSVAVLGRGWQRDWIALGNGRPGTAGTPALIGGATMLGGSLLIGDALAPAAVVIALSALAALVWSLVLNRIPRRAEGRAAVDGWMLTSTLADQVLATSDTLLLALLRSPTEAGIYAAVYRIPNAWLIVVGLLAHGSIPAVTRKAVSEPGLVTRLAIRRGAILAPAVALAAPLAYFLVPVLFGEEYVAGRWAAVTLMLAAAAATFAAPLLPVYLARGWDRSLATIGLVAAGLNLSLNLVAIPIYGVNGAALTTLLSMSIVNVLHAFVLRRGRHRGVQSTLRNRSVGSG